MQLGESPEVTQPLHGKPGAAARAGQFPAPETACLTAWRASSLCFPSRYGCTQGPSGVWNYGEQPDPALEVPAGQVRPLPAQLQPCCRPASGDATSQRHHLHCPERPETWSGIRRPPEGREGQAQEQACAREGVHRWGQPLSFLRALCSLWGLQTQQPGRLHMRDTERKHAAFSVHKASKCHLTFSSCQRIQQSSFAGWSAVVFKYFFLGELKASGFVFVFSFSF